MLANKDDAPSSPTTAAQPSPAMSGNLQRAVNFLRDPSIISNPDTPAKVQFLLTTGLSREEVEAAMRMVHGGGDGSEDNSAGKARSADAAKDAVKVVNDVPTSTPAKQAPAAKANAGTPATAPLQMTPDRHGENDDDDDGQQSVKEEPPSAAAGAESEADAGVHAPPIDHINYLSSNHRSDESGAGAASSSSSCSSVSSEGYDSHSHNAHSHAHSRSHSLTHSNIHSHTQSYSSRGGGGGGYASSNASGSNLGSNLGSNIGSNLGSSPGRRSVANSSATVGQRSWREAARFPGRTKLARWVVGGASAAGTANGGDDTDADDDVEEYKPLPVDYSGVADDANGRENLPHLPSDVSADNDATMDGNFVPMEMVDGQKEVDRSMVDDEEKEVDVSALTASDLMGEVGAAADEEGNGHDGGNDARAMSFDEEESTAMDSIELGDATSAQSAEVGEGDKVGQENADARQTPNEPKQDEEPSDQPEEPAQPRANIASASRRMLLQIQERRHAAMLAREAEEAKNGNGNGDSAAVNDGAGSRASRFFARAVRKASRDRVGSAADAGGGLVPLEEGMGPTLAAAIAADVEAETVEQSNTNDTNGSNISIVSDDRPPSTSPSTDDEEGEEDTGAVADLKISGTNPGVGRSRADSKMSENHSDLEQCEWLETSSDEEDDSEKDTNAEANEAEVDEAEASAPSESSSISSNAGSAPADEVYGDDFSDVEEKHEEGTEMEEEASPITLPETYLSSPSEQVPQVTSPPEKASSEATESTPEKTPEIAMGNKIEREGNGGGNHAEVAAAAALGTVAVGAAAAAAVQAKSPPPTASPSPKHVEQSHTPTSSSLGLLMSSLRTAAAKSPTELNSGMSREPPVANTTLESVDETNWEEGASQYMEGKTQELDTAYEVYEDQPPDEKDAIDESRSSPSDEALSEDSLQDRIASISDTLNDEDETIDDIQSAVPPPPNRRSDESLLRTGGAGIYQGESIPHGFGSMTFANGTRFVGNWVHGEPSGEGTLYLANGEAKHGRWRDGDFEQYDCIAMSEEGDVEGSEPSASSSESSSGYDQADDELSAQELNRTKFSSRRSIDPSGWDNTNDPSICSTLEPNRRNLDDAESPASSPKRPTERASRKSAGAAAVARTSIPDGDSAGPNFVDDAFLHEDRDLEKGETESAMQRRRKYLREKRWYSCLPILLVLGGAACLGGGIYVWWLYLGPGKENANSSATASSGSGLGDTFSGPTNGGMENRASSSRPIRDDDGSEDVI